MEKVVLVAITLKFFDKENLKSTDESIEELSNLVKTAGGIVIKTFLVKRDKIDPAYYVGLGKVEEIAKFVSQNNIHTVVFDDELSLAQVRNLEQKIEAKIIDRSRLILDIFAKRAHTKEAQLQVEYAQLKYMLPRLTQKGIYMDNQVGGIGTRGPGEKKLEYDRRRIIKRIEKIKEELNKIIISRQQQRKLRSENQIPIVVLVGYTNTGKSTLFNFLLKSNQAYADDKLFATLDPLIRKLRLPNSNEVLLVDTVGFINKLPHHLIESFKSTLEIVKEANLILQVIDLTNYTNIFKRQKLVEDVLDDLNVKDVPIIKVYNKIDMIEQKLANFFIKKFNNTKDSVVISAKTGFGTDNLLKIIQNYLNFYFIEKTIKISLQKNNINELIKFIYKYCKIISNYVNNNYIYFKIYTTKQVFKKINFMLKN